MAKEWNEFWRKSNEFDYEGTAGGEHNTMIRRANELHGELEPIDWSKFEATDVFDEEVYGIYEEQFIAVSRLDYDAYCEAAQHCEDMELLKAQESGLYDFDYGSYDEKKQQDTDMQENKDHNTYMDHCDSLYKEKAMNQDTHIDANNAVSGDMESWIDPYSGKVVQKKSHVRPSHYESSNPDVPAIQMWDYALSQNLGFFEGNIIKYVSRWRQKGGVQDLQKALTYLQRLIDSQASPNP